MLHGCHWKWYFSEVLMRNWKVSQCDSPVVERALILQWVLQFYSRVRVAGWRTVICKLYTVKFYNWQIMKRSISPSLSVCHRRYPDTDGRLPLQVYVDTPFATQPGSAGTRQIGATHKLRSVETIVHTIQWRCNFPVLKTFYHCCHFMSHNMPIS